ncbi:hypothetical protein B0H14DRAFT_3705721 [Mycena olivaceomarginata]|nr:hypothetical protein B0H14DRAFT_3705721 [Mycena olivaceomarginata]
MPFEFKKGRKRRASDADYAPPSSVKRTRTAVPSPQLTPLTSTNHPDPQLEEDTPSDDPLPPSSAPGSPTFWDDDNELLIDETPIHAPAPLQLQLPTLRDSPLPETPPTSPSGGGPLTSPFLTSPVKAYGGRPRVSAPHRNPRGIRAQKQNPKWKDLQEARETAASVEAQMLQLEAERDVVQKRDRAKQRDIYSALEHLTSDGTPMHKVFELLFAARPEDPKMTAMVTKALQTHGPELLDKWVERAPESVDTFLSKRLADLVQREGQAIQNYLTRESKTQVTHLLSSFDMQGLGVKLKEMAPTLWEVLTAASSTHSLSTEVPETRRDRSLVFTTVCAMMSILRSQKANNFQAVIALFLLGSGASKREIEASLNFRRFGERVCARSSGDNLNIAFRVESQRLDNKNHFDNGTTATLIPIYNPFTNESRTPRGTLPFSMKPERTSTVPNYPWTAADTLPSPSDAENTEQCLIWQLKSIALEYIPSLHISSLCWSPLHKTEQFPLSAMHEDESTLEGIITVINKLFEQLKASSADLEDHGLVFANGDLLTDNLVNTVEGARRNSTDPLESMQPLVRRLGIFHAKMAGNRLVVNEHWGKPNATIPGAKADLCWLEVEKSSALEAMPRATADFVCRSYSRRFPHPLRRSFFPEWAAKANFGDFVAVAGKVYSSLYTTAAYDNACARSEATRDAAFENSVLYNHDSLLYLLLVSSIKAGDIGRVILVFRIWAVMMRSPKTMPKYADAFFETLNRIKTYDPVLQKFFLHNWLVNITGIINRFKEVDLLQEHQNFWAKIIYNAKGVNRSWSWLGRITVCIFALRDAMKTVHAAFKIPDYGTKHTVPDMQNEILRVAEALQKDRIQELWSDRPWKDQVVRVRDLFEEGLVPPGSNVEGTNDTTALEDEENTQEDYEVSQEDLAMDDEEPYEMIDSVVGAAMEMIVQGLN